MIITAAGGYVTGTYLTTAAIATLITTASATIGLSAAIVTGVVSAIVGSAGIFGTTIGATGATGMLMSAGILPSTPIVVPIALGSLVLGSSYVSCILIKLRRKLKLAKDGEEVNFTAMEAKIIALLIKRVAKKPKSNEFRQLSDDT